MRKLYYLPHHIKDRLDTYRKKHDMVDENEAIIRLLDIGLTEAEKNYTLHQNNAAQIKKPLTYDIPDIFRWQSWWMR